MASRSTGTAAASAGAAGSGPRGLHPSGAAGPAAAARSPSAVAVTSSPAGPPPGGYGSPPPATPRLDQLVRPPVRLLVWGRSDMGQLGPPGASSAVGNWTGESGAIPLPVQLEALSGKDVVGGAAGPFHSAFVTADGEVYTCGCNDSGQLGRRTLRSAGGAAGGANCVRPTHVTALESYNVAAAGCGAAHTVVATEQGGVLSWGGNEFGQTGCGSEGNNVHHPRPLKGLGDQRIVRIAVGANHALLLSGSGTVFAVGQGSFGALGLGEGLLESRSTPVSILPLMPLGIVQVAAGENHSAALTADGRVFTWGRGKHGQLGHGDWDNRSRPVQVAALRGIRAKQVACGGDHTLVLAEAPPGRGAPPDPVTHTLARPPASTPGSGGGGSGSGGGGGRGGAVYSFGRGTWGATGLGSTDNTCRPCRVQSLEGEDIVQISAGLRHSLALSASHAIFAFGNNDFGQLGLGSAGSKPHANAAVNGGAALRGSSARSSSSSSSMSCCASPRRVDTLPRLPVLAVVAAGDCSMALLLEARPGELSPAGPRPGRRHGAHLIPYTIPDLGRLATAAATASADPRAVREVAVAVEDVLSSPGYLRAAFEDHHDSCGSGSGSQQQLLFGEAAPAAAAGPKLSAAGRVAAADGLAAGGGVGRVTSRGSSPALMRLGEADGGSSAGAGTGAGAPQHGMNVMDIQGTFEALLRLYSPEVVAALGSALLRLLEALMLQATTLLNPGRPLSGGSSPRPVVGATERYGGGQGGGVDLARLTVLRCLFVVYQCPLLAGAGMATSLASRLIAVTLRLPLESQQLLLDWLVSLPAEVLGGRVVRPLQHYLGHLAEGGSGAAGPELLTGAAAIARSELLATARVVAGLHAANERAGCKIPFTEFHNVQLSNSVNLRSEYRLWLQMSGGGSHPPLSSSAPWALNQTLISLCQVPCLLTPEAKSRILQGEAQLQKDAEVSASAREALMQGLHPASVVFLDIAVRRASILADAAQQLADRPAHHLKRPLRVSFVSQGVAEEGVDQGGVSREFFQLLVAEIFQPQYGMFVYSEETRTFWFNTAAGGLLDASSVAEFRLVGAVLGLAIYNGVILDVHFPQAVYKKLLGEEVGLPDLVEAFPTLGRSLQAVLAMDPDQVEDVLCKTFEVQYEFFGEQRTVPLIPGGSSVPVTGANRERFVQRMVEWTLNESVETQFRSFAHGFHQVCGGPALSLFRHEELELLICGLPHLDFGALEANARYDGGYHRQHPTIVMFWQVLSGLDLDQKRRFLAFTTGCDRAPVAGLGALVLTIQRSGPDSERLPAAHTCFNTLLLPDYSTRAKLKTKLLVAIENAQGFGLK